MKKGFTLLELLATIAIMAVLIAAVLPFVSNYTNWAKKTQAARSALLVADAINRFNALAGASETAATVITGTEGTLIVPALLGTTGAANTIRIDGQVSKFLAKAPSADVTIAANLVSVRTNVTGDTVRTAAF